MKDFYQKLLNTAAEAGIPIISDDHCCKLLAWVYAYGGANEAVLFNMKLNSNILYAQKRLNIVGGEIPNKELFPLLQKYLKEVSSECQERKPHPQWAYEICDQYGLSHKCIQ